MPFLREDIWPMATTKYSPGDNMFIRHHITSIWFCIAAFQSQALGFVPSGSVSLQSQSPQKCSPRDSETSLMALEKKSSLSRRCVLSTAASCLSSLACRAVSPVAASESGLVADLPMIRLRLPQGGFGREYVVIKLQIKGQGPYDFMVDTGLTAEFITPHLQQLLGIGGGRSSKITGLAAGGSSEQNLIELEGASLCCGDIKGGSGGELSLPTLHAIITDFPQEHMDPAHDPVEGMLGMEVLSLYDVDFDFAAGRLRLWRPGTAATVAVASGMVSIPAVVINETGLIGIRVSSVPTDPSRPQQPILGFLDCGSSFSAVNWAAAKYLGLPERGDSVYSKGPVVAAMGIDGRPLQLPTLSQRLTFTGDVLRDQQTGRPIGFAPPPSNWKLWDETRLAIGDLPAFETVLGDGKTAYRGPAALIGLDVLAQRRVIIETGAFGTRQRRVFVGAN